MRKNYTGNILFTLLFIFFMLAACKNEHNHSAHVMTDTAVLPSVKLLNTQVTATIPTITPESGTRIFSLEINGSVNYDTRKQSTISSRFSGRIEKLNIRFNFQPVKKGELLMEIYSPDLAAAQREYLYVAEAADEVMIRKARQRLELLGMRASDIADLNYEKEILYNFPVYADRDGYIIDKSALTTNITAGSQGQSKSDNGMGAMEGSSNGSSSTSSIPAIEPSPIFLRQGQYVSAGQPLFTIYHSSGVIAEFAIDQQTAPYVKKSQKLLLHSTGNRNDLYPATIGLIEPVLRNGQYFTLARVYVDKEKFHIGQLLTANIPVVIPGGWWLPEKSVMKTGTRSIVFRRENGGFKPVEIKAGAAIHEMIQVLNDISNWQIAANASYLVDSESFIQVNTNTNK